MAAARKTVRLHAPRLAREQRVDEILVAARDLFCEKGYDAASVAEIAARIGVVEGLVYKYFSTKRELLLQVLERWYDELFGDTERALSGIDEPRERVRVLVRHHLRAVRDDPQLCKLMFREVQEVTKYHGSALHARNRRYTQFLVDEIESGQRAGAFRADVPPRLFRDLVYGGIEHATWNYLRGHGRLDIDTLAEQIASLLCEGLIPRPQGSTAAPRKKTG
ncbi:TetR/AcrR family transcriptional regulator [Fontimonas sp. SYSU GA230001]|uniref:TetR/AcrR family transcriptional regulator n=1 Tax=Fontimonas sp. SYSU GA230001 TaxID=3142450 RepID=UPI0032B475FF